MNTKTRISLPRTVNLHITADCNYRCAFCFSHFDDRPAGNGLSCDMWKQILYDLKENGCAKVTFAGGEPTLYPHLEELLRFSKEIALTTSIVSNGTRLEPILENCGDCVDIVGLSIDSSKEAVLSELGRGSGRHLSQTTRLADLVHRLGIRLKINTVVTSLILHENMTPLIGCLRPNWWKIFQVLSLEGENADCVRRLRVSDVEFQTFVDRHRLVESFGVTMFPESSSTITGSYLMIDPWGRFFDDITGRTRYSCPIPNVGLAEAWNAVFFDATKFDLRGGNRR